MREFLNAWYVRHADYTALMQYVAKDNALSDRGFRAEMNAHGAEPAWSNLFRQAFTNPNARFETLSAATSFHGASVPPQAHPLHFINTNLRGEFTGPFGILDPKSAPPGSLFPPSELSSRERQGFDGVAAYLDHLNQTYASRGLLYVVLYITSGPGLLHETAVQYWIFQDGQWGLALYEGTDW